MRSLKSRNSELSDSAVQLQTLNAFASPEKGRLLFNDKLRSMESYPLKPRALEIFQVNLGKMCNQVCKHCHVDAGPDRREIMNREIMELCLQAIRHSGVQTVDITGGAPEMNPDFRWFVEQLTLLGKHIMVRCNLTIILANKKYLDLPGFYRNHQVEVVASLPYFSSLKTDAQRGTGVFDQSVRALLMLNALGYGKEGTGLLLNLVYNPAGAYLPPSQDSLEREFRNRLRKNHGIDFNHLYTITNLPVSRFLEYLIRSGNYEEYMDKLINAFNPAAAMNVMCRNTLSVGWDGYLYDCDFNQMLDLRVQCNGHSHIAHFDSALLKARNISTNQHCFGCTAGAGSSCGGAISEK